MGGAEMSGQRFHKLLLYYPIADLLDPGQARLRPDCDSSTGTQGAGPMGPASEHNQNPLSATQHHACLIHVSISFLPTSFPAAGWAPRRTAASFAPQSSWTQTAPPSPSTTQRSPRQSTASHTSSTTSCRWALPSAGEASGLPPAQTASSEGCTWCVVLLLHMYSQPREVLCGCACGRVQPAGTAEHTTQQDRSGRACGVHRWLAVADSTKQHE